MNGENAPPILAATPPPPDQGGNGLPKNFDDLARKRRGSLPGVPRGAYKKRPPLDAPAAALPAAPQFTPENCRYLVELPFNLALVRTGYSGFLLSETESATLSASAATVLNNFVAIDPKWAALIMFSISLGGITTAKVMQYRVALAELELRKKNANGTETNAATKQAA